MKIGATERITLRHLFVREEIRHTFSLAGERKAKTADFGFTFPNFAKQKGSRRSESLFCSYSIVTGQESTHGFCVVRVGSIRPRC
jgi:hypothetical protein